MRITGEKETEMRLERCSNGWITEMGGVKKIHSDAYSAWMHIGDFLIPGEKAEDILEEILEAKSTALNLKFTKVKIKEVK
jgi:hypothetical protein